VTQISPCPLCGKPPGTKVGPPALTRCVNKDCEGSKLGALTIEAWNEQADAQSHLPHVRNSEESA
jgi:hypothetical protein